MREKRMTILCCFRVVMVVVFGGLGAFWTTTEGAGAGTSGDRRLLASVNNDAGDTTEAGSVAWDHHRESVDEAFVGRSDSVEVAVGRQQRRLLAAYWDTGYSDLVFESVSAGGFYIDSNICGVTVDGSGYCWGENNYGQLGDGSNSDSTFPVEISGGRFEWKSVSAGYQHACGITTAGLGYCWGLNDYGQLGIGTDSNRLYPVEIDRGRYQWSDISAGFDHTCGVTVDASGYCWGWNNDGQLGDNSVSDSYLPVEIDGGRFQWKSLSVGAWHTCGITTTGLGYCWGDSDYGQLWGVTDSYRLYLAEIDNGKSQWSQISAGTSHTCGVAVDGSGYCWGENDHGQLGDGTNSDSALPVEIDGGRFGWKSLSVGGYHTCGITTDDIGYCWGDNHYGELGIGTNADSYVPAQIKGGEYQWATISAGYERTCGITTDGTLYCWGKWSIFDGPGVQSLPTQMTSQPPARGTSTNAGLIGGIVGGVVGAIIILAAGLFVYKRHKGKKKAQSAASSTITNGRLTDGDPGEKENASALAGPMTRPFFDSIIPTNTSPHTNNQPNGVSVDHIRSHPYQISHASNGSEWRMPGASAGQPQTTPSSSVEVIQASDLALGECIGQGSFGRVYKASWKRTEVVFKVFGGAHGAMPFSEAEIQALGNNLHKEASLMAKLRHPNVVQFLGVCLSPPGLVTEYCSRGSLATLLHEAKTTPVTTGGLSWHRRLGLLADAARGVLYLHTNSLGSILHRDLKSSNILVSHSWTAKVGDFGLSKVFEDYHSRGTTTVGLQNPRWLAPEVLDDKPFTKASDVFAFGVVMWEVLSCDTPWGSMNELVIVKRTLNGYRLDIPQPDDIPGGPPPDAVLSGYVSLMKQCWAQDPSARPDFEGIVDVLLELQSSLE